MRITIYIEEINISPDPDTTPAGIKLIGAKYDDEFIPVEEFKDYLDMDVYELKGQCNLLEHFDKLFRADTLLFEVYDTFDLGKLYNYIQYLKDTYVRAVKVTNIEVIDDELHISIRHE